MERQMTVAECKAKLVEAHRNGDDEAMRKLSQVKENLKKKAKRKCPDCGVAVLREGQRCFVHAVIFRWYRNKLSERSTVANERA